jgi:uronate dehydrogenase
VHDLPKRRRRTVLVTGAAGAIGRCLRDGLHGRYELRLLDVAAQAPARAGEKIVTVDLRDREATARALAGCDAVVHLAAIATEAPFDELLDANIAVTYSVFEGARRAGVRRVVFASSNHVTGYYPIDETIGPGVPVRPDSYYGVSKVFGEGLARLYAEKHSLEVVCLRIGAFRERPLDERDLAIWLSARDCVQLVERALDAVPVRFLTVYGISANTRSWYETEGWEQLGYEPRDDGERFAGEVGSGPPGWRLQGGRYACSLVTEPRRRLLDRINRALSIRLRPRGGA